MTDKIRLFPKSVRAAVLGLAAVSLTALATPAYAGGKGYYGGDYYSGGYYAGGGRYYDRGHHGGGYGGNRYYRGRGGISGGEAALIGLGIIGGAILIDRALDDRRYDDRRYDDRRYDDRRYDDRYDRRAGAADDDYYYYQRDARPYEDDNRVRSARDDGDASEADLLGAGSAGSVAVNAAFRECVAETRGAAGAGGLQVAMPGVPTEVETLADGSVRMTAQFRATNGRGQDFTRRFVCEADDRGVRFLQVD